MAGIPDSVIERAKSILSRLETNFGGHIPLFVGERTDRPGGLQGDREITERAKPDTQLDLFPSPYEILMKELGEVDIESITPLEALNILDRLKRSIST